VHKIEVMMKSYFVEQEDDYVVYCPIETYEGPKKCDAYQVVSDLYDKMLTRCLLGGFMCSFL